MIAFAVRIGIDPNIAQFGGVVLSWHGAMTFVAVAVAVVMVGRWARAQLIDTESVYSIAVWAVVGGILGARFVHVIDRWDFYGDNLGQILTVWQGGIGLYGAIIFGFVGGSTYVWGRQLLGRIYLGQTMGSLASLVPRGIKRGYLNGAMYAKFKDFSVGRLADITAPAMLIAQTIGRIGDIINGEHLAIRTDAAWGFIYSHPGSLSFHQWGLTASHPVIVYEMIWNMVVLAVIWKLRDRLAPPGMLFAAYLMLYALGRFVIQFMRLDKEWFAGLQEAHIISIIVLVVCVPLIAYRARWVTTSRSSSKSSK